MLHFFGAEIVKKLIVFKLLNEDQLYPRAVQAEATREFHNGNFLSVGRDHRISLGRILPQIVSCSASLKSLSF